MLQGDLSGASFFKSEPHRGRKAGAEKQPCVFRGQVHVVERSATLNTCAEETQGVSEGGSQSDSERSELPARARETDEERSRGEANGLRASLSLLSPSLAKAISGHRFAETADGNRRQSSFNGRIARFVC